MRGKLRLEAKPVAFARFEPRVIEPHQAKVVAEASRPFEIVLGACVIRVSADFEEERLCSLLRAVRSATC